MWQMIAGAVVKGIADGVGAQLKRKGEKKALSKQRAAIQSLKGTDLEAAKKLTLDQDKQYYIQSKQFFREQDPDLAAARAAAVRKTRDVAEAPYAPDQVVAQAMKEQLTPDSQVEDLRQTLLARAKEDLALGATLPPEYQAELVRAGLENVSATGVGGSRVGPVTARTGTLLGRAGLELKSAREKAASDLLGADAALKASRASILGNLLSEAASAAAGKAQLAAGITAGADAATPSLGLRGGDLLQLQLANEEFERSKTMALAGIDAQNELSKAARGAGIAASFGNMFGNMLGGMGGGGMPGGGGGGAPTGQNNITPGQAGASGQFVGAGSTGWQ